MKSKAALQTNQAPIYLEGELPKVWIGKDAITLKAEMLESAKEITAVTNPSQALSARNQRDDINSMLIDMEKYRKLVKEPVLKKGKEIDQTASSFTMDLTDQKLRLDKMLGDYARAEEEKKQAAAREAQRLADEAIRLEQERIFKEQAAERARLGAERAAEEAETAKERREAQKAQQEAERREQEAEALRQQQEEAQRQSSKSSMIATAPRMAGAAKPVIDFDVENIHLLYQSAPELVELTPRRREVMARLKAQQDSGLPIGIPGLRIREEWKVR